MPIVNNKIIIICNCRAKLRIKKFDCVTEAHPERFNSRLRNKMFYGQMGGKDLVRRKWKDLSEFVMLDCDGQDLTPKLKEHRVHAIVFLNIASYGGGTHPWGSASGTKEPSTEDGLIEVVGLTTYQLPLLQAGGHGTCIAQCSTAKLVTTRTIPMQVNFLLFYMYRTFILCMHEYFILFFYTLFFRLVFIKNVFIKHYGN